MSVLNTKIETMTFIGSDVSIGDNTRIWQFASVIRGAVIGKKCNVGAGAIIDAARVGDNVLIGAGAQLHPGTVIGDNVFIGPGVIFCNDRWPRVSKDGFDSEALLSGTMITVQVCDGASIGAGAVILPGVRIGKDATVAAGARVDESVPDNHLAKREGDIVPIAARCAERMRGAA